MTIFEFINSYVDKETSNIYMSNMYQKEKIKKKYSNVKDFYLDYNKINNIQMNYIKELKFQIIPRYSHLNTYINQ